MSQPITLHFASTLRAPPERIWEWITSVEGISSEMRPYFRMTSPRGVHSLADLRVEPGQRLFRSYVFLFGILPIDYSDMTLLELTPGTGFVEQSPMGSMTLWRHERRLRPTDAGTVVEDRLTFQPRRAKRLVGWFIRRVFRHRHRVLKARLDGATPDAAAG